MVSGLAASGLRGDNQGAGIHAFSCSIDMHSCMRRPAREKGHKKTGAVAGSDED